MSANTKDQEVIYSKIWNEEPESDNPFAAKKCFCAGYDVFGDLLGKASWAEYIYLLFKLEKPTKQQAALLEVIAVILANPGIRDHSVRAAMNAGVGGSTVASALIAALAVGAGQLGGAHEIFLILQMWFECKQNLQKWENRIKNPPVQERADIWSPIEHIPGFDPFGVSRTKPVKQSLEHLCAISDKDSNLRWLNRNLDKLEKITKSPIGMSCVIATAFSDLELTSDQAEVIYLMLRLPGAAAHALEQKKHGWRKYPFFINGLKLENVSDD